MAFRQLPDADLLRKLLRYDSELGKLFWLPRTPDMFPEASYGGAAAQCIRWNSRCANKEAGHISPSGYRVIKLLGHPYKSHRLAWILFTGDRDFIGIDHINGDILDNRACNLRIANQIENCRNQSVPKSNTSGVLGVRWQESAQSWVAAIRVRGRTIHLGSFATMEDARQARLAANRKYGFHPNHGRAGVKETVNRSRKRKGTDQ